MAKSSANTLTDGKPSMDSKYNPNGSVNAIEELPARMAKSLVKWDTQNVMKTVFSEYPRNKDQHCSAVQRVRYFTGK